MGIPRLPFSIEMGFEIGLCILQASSLSDMRRIEPLALIRETAVGLISVTDSVTASTGAHFVPYDSFCIRMNVPSSSNPLRLIDREQLHLEDESAVGGNGALPALAVS